MHGLPDASGHAQGWSLLIVIEGYIIMKNVTRIIAVGIVLALAGCAGHHEATGPKKLTAQQMARNEVRNFYSGGPLTSHAPSLADYSLSGYGTTQKK